MKTVFVLALSALVMTSCGEKNTEDKADGGTTESSKDTKLTTKADSISYALGARIGNDIKNSGYEGASSAAMSLGLSDVMDGKESLLSEEVSTRLFGEFQAEMQQAQMAKQQAEQAEQAQQFEGNKQASLDFLAENAKKPGVTTTASGLQYEVVKMGTGDKPTLQNTVKAHYHGTRIDGTVFDSSVDRGEPIDFPLTGVIKGWTEALQLMPVGSKFKLYIPQELAYGASPRPGGAIQPYDALIFDVELVDIVK